MSEIVKTTFTPLLTEGLISEDLVCAYLLFGIKLWLHFRLLYFA